MSTKSKARAARRHKDTVPASINPANLPPEQRQAAAELVTAVLGMVTLGAVGDESR